MVGTYLSARETEQLTAALLSTVGSKKVPSKARLYELTGITKEAFSRYRSHTHTRRRMPVSKALEACLAVGIPFPFHSKHRRRGRILVSDGDHEEAIDALLFDWRTTYRHTHVCPVAQIATVVFVRWEHLGFAPSLRIQSPGTTAYSAGIRATNFDPGLQYEILLDLSKPVGWFEVVRHSLDTTTGKWLPSFAGRYTLSGDGLTDIDRRLKILQQNLQRNRGATAESRLQQARAFEESVITKFSKLQRPL